MGKGYRKKQETEQAATKSGTYSYWTPEEIKALKRMWVQGLCITKIAKTLRRSHSAITQKKSLLKLPKREGTPKGKIESGTNIPTRGIVKCHNCLEEIELSKNGLDKDYRGILRYDRWLFWHLPGQCTGDPNAHANLLYEYPSHSGYSH